MVAQHRRQHRQSHSQTASARPGAIAAGLIEDAGQQASQMVGWLKNEGTVFVATRKHEAADELSKFGAAIRRAAENLNEQNSGAAAKYAESAAESIDRAAKYLQKTNLNELIDDASRAAKRNPTLFLGGFFLAGLAAARFTKAAGARSPGRRSSR